MRIDPSELPLPHQVECAELDAAVVVAVDEAAHRPMMQAQFQELMEEAEAEGTRPRAPR